MHWAWLSSAFFDKTADRRDSHVGFSKDIMIGYIEGKLLKKEKERVLILANQLGYEILLPAVVMESLQTKAIGDSLELYIYYHQTERQPKPVLIGFNMEVEKEFFQYFISVEDIGPMKAVKAMNIPVRDIARAIESGDLGALQRLNGVGSRTAQKIVATLSGKMEKFALIHKGEVPAAVPISDLGQLVLDVLTKQLGHKTADAKRMIAGAMDRNPAIATPEELFDEIYRGEEFA
jgi:Holliday junction DNA helicase RuvA